MDNSREVVDISGGVRRDCSDGQVGEVSRGQGLIDRADDGNIVLGRVIAFAVVGGGGRQLVGEADDELNTRQVGGCNLGRVDDETGLAVGAGRKSFGLIRVLGLVKELEAKVLRVGIVEQMNLLSLGPVAVDGGGDSTGRHDGGCGLER